MMHENAPASGSGHESSKLVLDEGSIPSRGARLS